MSRQKDTIGSKLKKSYLITSKQQAMGRMIEDENKEETNVESSVYKQYL